MGNRALITGEGIFYNGKGMALYLHWNGGMDSVKPLLDYCKMKGYRGFGEDDSYAMARLAQVACNFMGGTLSVGVDVWDFTKDPWCDNGIYVVKGWDIVERKYFEPPEQDEYDYIDFLNGIDRAMPENERLGFYVKECELVDYKDVNIGDEVYVYDDYYSNYDLVKVYGFGDGIINGHDVTGVPYVGMYGYDATEYKKNCNNYLSLKSMIFRKKSSGGEKAPLF